jgi:hypothetical protein
MSPIVESRIFTEKDEENRNGKMPKKETQNKEIKRK